MKDVNIRESNIELLRVIAMLMVIMLHALRHGGILDSYDFATCGYIFFWTIEILCYVAVDIFVLITGYFMINLQMTLSRIIKFVIQIETFSVLCLLIACLFFHEKVTLSNLVYAIFPLTGNEYWFASAYVILLSVIPLINLLIKYMSKKQLKMGTLLLTFVFSIIATIFPWSRNGAWTAGHSFVWFIVLYFVGACMRLCGQNRNAKGYLVIYFVLSCIHMLSRLIIGEISRKTLGNVAGEGWFTSYNSAIVLLAAVALFLFFKNLYIQNGKMGNIINFFGRLSFGAYLCSDHNLIREPLWRLIDLTGKTNLVIDRLVYTIIIVIFIFLVGCFIEWLRNSLLKLLKLEFFLKKVDLWFDRFKCTLEKAICD